MLTDLAGVDLLLVLGSIIISMTVHEAMHGFVAHWLGDSTAQEAGRLTLNPLKHIDVMTTVLLPMVMLMLHLPPIFAAKPVPFNPDRVKFDEFGAALIGVSGPLTNLVMAGIGGLIFRAFGADLGVFGANAVITFTAVNIGFFVFNMIPWPPLDGSRLLYAFAPEPLQNVMRTIESYGFMSIMIFIFIIFTVGTGVIFNVQNGLTKAILGM